MEYLEDLKPKRVKLSKQDSKIFVNAINNPSNKINALVEAFKIYKEVVISDIDKNKLQSVLKNLREREKHFAEAALYIKDNTFFQGNFLGRSYAFYQAIQVICEEFNIKEENNEKEDNK